ncbi:MAG: PPC domain-containing protein [Candidatus Polarisedimenticolia bacterium]
MNHRRALALAATLSAAALAPSMALANWTASGRFVYVDRAYDQTGFTGPEPSLNIRFADVEVLDSRNRVLATGPTDAGGFFSIPVVDSSTRTVYVRVASRSTRTPGLFIDVRSSTKSNFYTVRGSDVVNHNPTVNVNFGTITALKGQGGEVFNIFDQMVRGADYIASLTGSRPTASLATVWKIDRGQGDSTYSQNSRQIFLRDSGGYDDTVLLHEMGHFFIYQYSASDSPDTAHTFSNCTEDIRLAYEEGYATYFGNSSLRYAGLAGSNIYMRSNGGPAGPGSLVRYADLETDTQYLCQGATSEMNVIMVLWDINDGPSTPDTTPGVDDAHDLLVLPDSEVWQVQRDYVRTALNKSTEDFWDGWFVVNNGFLPAMQAIFGDRVIQYIEDGSEVNNTAATATLITVGNPPLGATFFYDQDGNGVGAADTDYYAFTATGGLTYTAQTVWLLSDGNTMLELLGTNGSTVLASNNNRATGDDSSLVVWTAPADGVYYLRITHAADFGIYGNYWLWVTNP